MSPRQRNMLFGEWAKCWATIVEKNGRATTDDERTVRLAVARKAIGRAVASWSDIGGQKEIDWLLVCMFGISRSGDFASMMRLVNQPVTRMECSVWAQTLLAEIGIEPGGREAYVDGICRRIHKQALLDIDDAQWQDVLRALNHTRMHKHGVAHTHPRSVWQRRGGKNLRGAGAPAKAAAVPGTGGPARTGSVTAAGDDEDPF